MSYEWENLVSREESNPAAKLFRAIRAWHFLTKIRIAFLILGTVELLARPEDPGQGGGWVFASLVLVIAGDWRNRRATSRGPIC